MTTYYCVDKSLLKILSSGPTPEVWGNISGMKDLPYNELSDLSWANYPNNGFLTREDVLAIGISESDINIADGLYKKSTVPNNVTSRQLRLSLLDAGILTDVDSAINAISDATLKTSTLIEWDYAQSIARYNSLVLNVISSLGKTEDQLDDIFIKAATFDK
jgi:hypothetical protein